MTLPAPLKVRVPGVGSIGRGGRLLAGVAGADRPASIGGGFAAADAGVVDVEGGVGVAGGEAGRR